MSTLHFTTITCTYAWEHSSASKTHVLAVQAHVACSSLHQTHQLRSSRKRSLALQSDQMLLSLPLEAGVSRERTGAQRQGLFDTPPAAAVQLGKWGGSVGHERGGGVCLKMHFVCGLEDETGFSEARVMEQGPASKKLFV
eukprot:1158408-Pelagomonas_calceolata.AAC.5